MSDISHSLVDWVREKINAPLYIVFSLSYLIWNWKYFFALFIEDKVPENSTRFLYAQSMKYQSPFDLPWTQADIVLSFVYTYAASILPVIAITYLALYELPKVHAVVHKKSLDFYFERKAQFDIKSADYEKKKTEELKNLKTIIQEQRQVTEDIVEQKQAQQIAEKSLSKEEVWESEFVNFKKSKHYSILSLLADAVTKSYIVESDFHKLAYVAVAELGSLDKDHNRVELTDKGKYFVRRYLEEQS